MIMFRKEEKSDEIIQEMVSDKDPIIRYGAMFVIGMAYIGSSNQKQIRQLLHMASSDHNDDVKRAAVINLGFVMLNTSKIDKLVQIIHLLSQSYNPHIRYAAALALAIATHSKPSLAVFNIL